MRRSRLFVYEVVPVRFLSRFSPSICGLLVGLITLLPLFAAAEEKVVIEQLPVAVRSGSAQLTGHYNPDQKLRLVFALKPPHLQEEEEFLQQLQDPNSPQFHQYLSEAEWNQRFAPSAADEQAVVAWAQSQGFTITQRYDNRLLVDVEAPSAIIEKALDVTMNSYQINGDSYFSNDRDPSLPAHLVGTVHSVMGLNNIQVVHSFSKHRSQMRPPDYSPGPAYALGPHQESDAHPRKVLAAKPAPSGKVREYGGYSIYAPYDIYNSQAYDYNALHLVGACCNPTNDPNGAGALTSIAIAIWGDYYDWDLYDFLLQYDTLASNVQRHFIDGTPQCCYEETTLDVEWATATSNSFDTASDTAKILMYEGINNTASVLLDVINHILHDNHARVLSMSWGGAESDVFSASDMDTYHAVFNQLLGQGWTIVAASGDGGATDGCADHLSVSYPASDPDVVAVGGTTLVLNSGPFYSTETGWAGGVYGCANNDGGSGGGCSTHFAAPTYQSSPVCGRNSRSVPDIALNADGVNTPQLAIFLGDDAAEGGTSIAAPEMAGFFAQANAYLLDLQTIIGATCGGSLNAPCAPLGNANPYLYYVGYHPSSLPHYPFYDITYGCNGNDITQQYHLTPFCSAEGYDQVTGWGSVNMMQLAWTLNDFMAGDAGDPIVSVSGPPINQWYNVDQTVNWTIADTSGNAHLPIGVSGWSMAWDVDPGDAQSEPTPGAGNGFYGPQSKGNSGSASGLIYLSQGCHYAYVRAWDNAGQSGLSTYGPLCLDTLGPVTTIALSGNSQGGGNYTGPVQVSISATDIGSPITSISYSVNNSRLQNYTAPFFEAVPGYYTVWADSTDLLGNGGSPSAIQFNITSNAQYLVVVDHAGNGGGTITSMDGIIHCGTYCSHHYYDEQPVTLTAAPNAGSVFGGWSGCDLSDGLSCTFTMTADRVVYATFNVPQALQFIPLTPCRVADTRLPQGPFGGPSLQRGIARDFAVPNSNCNVPATAAAYSVNVTAVPHGSLGYLTVWPSGQDRPIMSILNSPDGRTKANAAIVPAGSNQAITFYASDTADVVLDIDGYFVPVPNPPALAFYPVTPCRIADTRKPIGPLGGPSLVAQQARDLPVLSSACGIPSTAQAYSLNFTAVPKNDAPIWIFNAWPVGKDEPGTSVLNDPTGTIVANAAIVPAGTGGDINVVASNDSDVVVDVDGYFAPPGQGGLSLYANEPCRVIDTRKANGLFDGTLVVNVVGSNCDVPATAQAYALNATALPSGPLWILTIYPDGAGLPIASTLNALDGAFTSNMAIVPSSNGSVDAAAAGLTNLILDISGYFAP